MTFWKCRALFYNILSLNFIVKYLSMVINNLVSFGVIRQTHIISHSNIKGPNMHNLNVIHDNEIFAKDLLPWYMSEYLKKK